MRLTEQTRYALRVMATCARSHPDIVRVADVATDTGLTEFTVFKLLKIATKAGLIVTTRGRNGGIHLGIDPKLISVGYVVRVFEPRFRDCAPAVLINSDIKVFDTIEMNTARAIGLGYNAFLAELDRISILSLLEGLPKGASGENPRIYPN